MRFLLCRFLLLLFPLLSKFKKFVLILLWLLTTSLLHADETNTLQLNELVTTVDLRPLVQIIEDKYHVYKLKEIQSGLYDNLWQTYQDKLFVSENTASKYWFRVVIDWQADYVQPAVLHIKNQPSHLHYLTIAIPTEQSPYLQLFPTGFLQPYNSRDIDSLVYAFNLTLQPKRENIIYGYINNAAASAPIFFPLYLSSKVEFDSIKRQYRVTSLAFYAIMTSLLIYNLCLFINIKQKVYGYYILFLFTAITQAAAIEGSTLKWWMPNFPDHNNFYSYSNGVVMQLAYVMFVYKALDVLENWNLFKFAYRGLVLMGAGILFFNGVTQQSAVTNILVQLYSIFVLPFSLFFIVAAIIRRVPTSGYLLIAEIFLISGGSIFLLALHGLIPVSNLSFWSLHWGFLGEGLLLSLAVAARTNIAIRDKLVAQENAFRNERRAIEALEMSTKTKNQFLTTVSHELRTPLNSIIGFSNVLLDDATIVGSERDYIRSILNNGKQLLHVIVDVLNLSLIDSDRLSLMTRIIDVRALIHGLEVKYRLTAEKKGLVFVLEIDPKLPRMLELDDEHLKQILGQLLDNAFKFTQNGHVKLKVVDHVKLDSSYGSSDDSFVNASVNSAVHQLECILTDSGIGIGAEKLQSIFNPFTQVDSTNSRRYSGTGVGLFIANRVAVKMGGSITVESTEGVGTRFSLLLPYKLSVDPAKSSIDIHGKSHQQDNYQGKILTQFQSDDALQHEAEIVYPLFRGHVLYAEDNTDNQQLVKLWVEKTGATITLVEDGVQAVNAVTQGDTHYDLILMDLQMPVMDGYEATRCIKKYAANTAIIAFSASALIDVDEHDDVKFSGYLGKPVEREQLYRVLAEFLLPIKSER